VLLDDNWCHNCENLLPFSGFVTKVMSNLRKNDTV